LHANIPEFTEEDNQKRLCFRSATTRMGQRRLFATKNRYLSLGVEDMQEGDQIGIFSGGKGAISSTQELGLERHWQ